MSIMKKTGDRQNKKMRVDANRNTMRERAFMIQILFSIGLIINVRCFTVPSSISASISQTAFPRLRNLKEHEGDFESKREYDPNSEYEIMIGRVLDSLKTDYPNILVEDPDYSIYSDSIFAKDPSGFTLNGLNNYKQAFALVHTVVNVFYSPEESLLTFKMIHDQCHKNIRVSWNAEVVPKPIFGGTKKPLHVNGISVYELNMKGKVQQHHVQNLLINNQPLVTHDSLLDALRAELSETDCVPVFTRVEKETPTTTKAFSNDNQIVRFERKPIFSHSKSLFSDSPKQTRSSLAALSATPSTSRDNSSESTERNLDWDAFEQKNKSRKRFGMKPLTPDEFRSLETKVKELESKQIAKFPASNDATQMPPKKSPVKGFLTKVFGEVFEDTCESNWDCERPEVCCDFKFTKKCCSSGQMMQVPQEILVTIPVTTQNDYYRPNPNR